MDSGLIDFDREIKALTMCRGIQETIQLYEVIENKESLTIVTNYVEGDDLVNFAMHNEIQKFAEPQIKAIARPLLHGLN